MYDQWSFKLFNTIGLLVHLFLIDIPKDLRRWLTLKQKDVSGKVIVITGGASGLGRKMAQIFAIEKQAKLIIIDINFEGAKETVSSIANEGGQAEAYSCDIRKEEELEKIASEIHSKYGKVDIVVCNAAVLAFAPFLDLKTEQLKKALDVNVVGTINTIRAFLKPMIDSNEGQVVAVSSIAGFSGETFGLAYCPTKFAVRAVMECLQMELRDRGLEGIACSTLCPYFARTPMVLQLGMRPTSTWFPFMSVESCSRRMVDAILKEKCISFMPNYVTFVPMIKSFLSFNTTRSLREYIDINYDTGSSVKLTNRRANDATKEYFSSCHILLWILALFVPLIFFTLGSTLERLLCCNYWIIYKVYMVLVLAHVIEAIYALLLCDEMRFSFACSAKWFIQTLLIGYPSLNALTKHVQVRRKLS
ncbi:unnamed protein product [Cylicocyclus nassatus]|uniref:Ketoreductase domain-containing protein n=1 Tax=Cylicocyclus nassatus TaxID=53992 RepID=A0AA36HF38_CYLNA|nr:unnamed protein product [Cylicocyclus nassatus]